MTTDNSHVSRANAELDSIFGGEDGVSPISFGGGTEYDQQGGAPLPDWVPEGWPIRSFEGAAPCAEGPTVLHAEWWYAVGRCAERHADLPKIERPCPDCLATARDVVPPDHFPDEGAAPLDSDAKERGQNMQTAIEKGVLQNRESDLAYIGSEGAAPRAEGLDARRQVIVGIRPYFEEVADTMDRSRAKPGARFADLLRDAWREMFDAVIEGPERAASCDRIVNNGMGEPTECGRSYPCDLHDEGAAPLIYRTDRDKNVKVRCMASMGYHEVTIEGGAPRAEGLDIERLAKALEKFDLFDNPVLHDAGWYDNTLDGARAIAREYARLSRPSDERN